MGVAIGRRGFVAAGAAMAIGARAHAEDLQIDPVSPAFKVGGAYKRFGMPGPFGTPERPTYVPFAQGLRGDVWLPKKPAARVVVFSHGELAVPLVYGRLLGHWTSHGFAVVAPVHDDSVIENGLRSAGGKRWDLGRVLEDPSGWRTRAAMCGRILEELGKLSDADGLGLDMSDPIIAGHSYGAYTAALLSGARPTLGDGRTLDVADARFRSALLLSPQGRGVMGLSDGSWDRMTGSALFVTGRGDEDGTGLSADAKAESFALSPPGGKHLAWFSSIVPALYSGSLAEGGDSDDRFTDLLAVTTAFLYIASFGDTAAEASLDGDYFQSVTSGRVSTMLR